MLPPERPPHRVALPLAYAPAVAAIMATAGRRRVRVADLPADAGSGPDGPGRAGLALVVKILAAEHVVTLHDAADDSGGGGPAGGPAGGA